MKINLLRGGYRLKYIDLPNELITNKDIDSNDFRVYSYILSFNSTSLEEISKRVNIKLSEVKKSVCKLKDLGFIKPGINII